MEHVPVLLNECLEGLSIKPDGVYIDGTLGRGGHAARIAEALTTGRLIGIDRDETAIREAGARLAAISPRVALVKANFRELEQVLDAQCVDLADGMLFDLGVSSPQLDDANRGFSYMHDAPLDMGMDREDGLSAYQAVNTWPEAELRRIFFEYGEERYSAKIAAAIVRRRTEKPIVSTFELVEIIKAALPASALREKQHPAKRCFQGLRIAVNDELGAIREVLPVAVKRLKPGGRICVISFHSLEDRIVKTAFASCEHGCTCPKDFPVCVCGFKPTLKLITRKPITAGDTETEENPRARSAKLRIAERI